MNIVLLGAPGAGKGTQAQNIRDWLGIPSISVGDILRAAIRDGTETGRKARSYVDEGALVPDEIVIAVVRERLEQPDCGKGFVLDGFPRTIPQAEALSRSGVRLDVVLSIEVPDSDIEERMTGRRVCPDCGASFHLTFNPPVAEGICDLCSQTLIRREDDDPETVRGRLLTYHRQTEPLKGYYQRAGLLRLVVGHDGLCVTTQRTRDALGLS